MGHLLQNVLISNESKGGQGRLLFTGMRSHIDLRVSTYSDPPFLFAINF